MANHPPLPTFEGDLWADDVLANPYPTYRQLRALGPVVWLERQQIPALTRFAEVRQALADWQTYSSAAGVSVDDAVNRRVSTGILTSDPPAHDRFRKPMTEQLSVASLNDAEDLIEQRAADLAAAVATGRPFDGVADLARPFSLHVVCDVAGLPDEGRNLYPELAERAFNVMGPGNDRLSDGLAALVELRQRTDAACPHLAPDSRGQSLVDQDMMASLINYTWPGIDTTVNGLASALALFADHPDQWDLLRSDPSLIPGAFNEVLRLHAPVQFFTRLATTEVRIDGTTIERDQRVLIMYGSANRDERRFPEPDRFDVTRNPTEQLAFGRGIHLCVGINLARLEAHAFLRHLVERVKRFEAVGPITWAINNTLQGPAQLPLIAHPA